MKERDFQKKIVKLLEDKGAFTFNVHGHSMQKKGIPDLYVAHPRFTGWLELKVGKNSLSPIQKLRIREMRRASAKFLCLRWVDGMLYLTDEEDNQLGLESIDSDLLSFLERGVSCIK